MRRCFFKAKSAFFMTCRLNRLAHAQHCITAAATLRDFD
jgi:hypothetical protein